MPWHHDELVAVLPAGHHLLEKSVVKFADLLDQPFVGHEKDSALLSLYRQHARALGRTLDERAYATSFESIRRLVESGLGVAILPAMALSGHASGTQTRPLDESWARRPLMLCVRSPERLGAAAKLLMRHLTSNVL
jgi:DNA-binding transcriptional LysR family regulator